MGTNYYYRASEPKPPCECCGRPFEEDNLLHIGKLSAGWEFSFRAHNELGLRSYTEWREFLGRRVIQDGCSVVDEYGRDVLLADFWTIVDGSKGKKNHHLYLKGQAGLCDYTIDGTVFSDTDGWSFTTSEFF